MDENRVVHRARPRPIDLRRKVLLKNFLREQMTYIPMVRESSEASLEVNGDSSYDDLNSSASVGNEENMQTPDSGQNDLSPSESALEPVPCTSNNCNSTTETNCEESDKTTTVESAVTDGSQTASFPKFSRFSNILRLKLSANKKKKKGITKAKPDLKRLKSPPKLAVLRSADKANVRTARERAKSIFSMFKARRDKKRAKLANSSEIKVTDSSHVIEPQQGCSTTNQSIQTDISWSEQQFNSIEQSNRCLREENRLLSESLSYIMSDINLDLSTIKKPYGAESYDSAESKPPIPPKLNSSNIVKSNGYPQNGESSRSKVLRSKSMQERTEKRNISSRLRTRSMNREFPERYDSRLYPLKEPYSVSRRSVMNSPGAKFNHFPLPSNESYVHRERAVMSTPSSNHQSPYRPNRSPVLKTLPINSSGRNIVRRSSMPERTYEPVRPILRHRSNSIREYSRRAYTSERPRYNQVKSPGRDKLRPFGDYNRPVPFQDLPSEAFY